MKISKYLYRYLSSTTIFCLDLFLSTFSSIVILFLLNFYSVSDMYKGRFSVSWIVASILFSVIGQLVFKTERIAVRHLSIRDFITYTKAAVLKELLLCLFMVLLFSFSATLLIAVISDGLLTISMVMAARIAMLLAFDFFKSRIADAQNCKRVLIYGTSAKSVAAINGFDSSKHHRVVGLLSDKESERGMKLSNMHVFAFKSPEDVLRLAQNMSVNAVLFTSSYDVQKEKDNLIPVISSNNIKALIAPPIGEVPDSAAGRPTVRDVRIEDLLGRPEIQISMDAIRSNFKDKVVLVTGAAGSIGSELCCQLAAMGVRQLILLDNAETPMHNLRLDLEARFPSLDFVPIIGSVRHKHRLEEVFKIWHPQVVFHAAAYKHVPLMEENPSEAVFANVYGTRLIVDRCVENDVEMMVMISTDKAVNPTNVMGCSKRLAEIYVQTIGLAIEQGRVKGKTKFVTTRFGNVLGSNGSVIPRFREQIQNGGPVMVTHPEITRFFMTIPEACRLVMEAATISTGNQIFVFDMGEPVKILDLATKMIELAGLKVGVDIQIQFIGLRPGEKLYEEVLADAENTIPTSHDRIRIAKVRDDYDYDEVLGYIEELSMYSRNGNVPEMIRLMKKVVPEFKSKNSIFAQYDKKII